MSASLIFDLHGQALRTLALRLDTHFQGLRAAASVCRRKRLLSSKLLKQLVRLDDALAVLRHITTVSAASFIQELDAALLEAGSDTSPTTCSGRDADLSADSTLDDLHPRCSTSTQFFCIAQDDDHDHDIVAEVRTPPEFPPVAASSDGDAGLLASTEANIVYPDKDFDNEHVLATSPLSLALGFDSDMIPDCEALGFEFVIMASLNFIADSRRRALAFLDELPAVASSTAPRFLPAAPEDLPPVDVDQSIQAAAVASAACEAARALLRRAAFVHLGDGCTFAVALRPPLQHELNFLFITASVHMSIDDVCLASEDHLAFALNLPTYESMQLFFERDHALLHGDSVVASLQDCVVDGSLMPCSDEFDSPYDD